MGVENLISCVTSFMNGPIDCFFLLFPYDCLFSAVQFFLLCLYGIDDLKTRVAEGMSDIFFFKKRTFDFFEN